MTTPLTDEADAAIKLAIESLGRSSLSQTWAVADLGESIRHVCNVAETYDLGLGPTLGAAAVSLLGNLHWGKFLPGGYEDRTWTPQMFAFASGLLHQSRGITMQSSDGTDDLESTQRTIHQLMSLIANDEHQQAFGLLELATTPADAEKCTCGRSHAFRPQLMLPLLGAIVLEVRLLVGLPVPVEGELA